MPQNLGAGQGPEIRGAPGADQQPGVGRSVANHLVVAEARVSAQLAAVAGESLDVRDSLPLAHEDRQGLCLDEGAGTEDIKGITDGTLVETSHAQQLVRGLSSRNPQVGKCAQALGS